MIIMTKGIVKIKKNRAFVEQQNGEVEVASGQYVYLKVENCWILRCSAASCFSRSDQYEDPASRAQISVRPKTRRKE